MQFSLKLVCRSFRSHFTGTSTGASFSLTKNTRNFAGLSIACSSDQRYEHRWGLHKRSVLAVSVTSFPPFTCITMEPSSTYTNACAL